MAAPNPNLCDHANNFWQTKPSCPPDMGGGWMTCEDEPTNRPDAGRPNHDNETVCLDCWQNMLMDAPIGLHYNSTIRATLNNLVYQQVMVLGNMHWVLQDNSTAQGVNNCLDTTQTLLCKYCVLDEIAQWRRCEADPRYADAMLTQAGRSHHADDGHNNTCICRQKYITHPHYCLQCIRDALDDRLLTATRNKDFLKTIAHTANGERRKVSVFWQNHRDNTDMCIPCRCGRDIDDHDRNILAFMPRATFCLACNGTKIYRDNIRPPRRSIRTTRAPLPSPALPYPLERETGDVLNVLERGLGPGARVVDRPR